MVFLRLESKVQGYKSPYIYLIYVFRFFSEHKLFSEQYFNTSVCVCVSGWVLLHLISNVHIHILSDTFNR